MLRTLLLATLLVPVASMHAAAQSRGGGCNDLSCSFRLLQRPAGDTIWASSEEWTRSGFFYSNGRATNTYMLKLQPGTDYGFGVYYKYDGWYEGWSLDNWSWNATDLGDTTFMLDPITEPGWYRTTDGSFCGIHDYAVLVLPPGNDRLPPPAPAYRAAFEVGPNPSRGQVTVTFDDSAVPSPVTEWTLTTLSGNVVWHKKELLAPSQRTAKLHLDYPEPGIYLLQLTHGRQTFSQKVVLQ